jgi:hypothetical protein
MTITGRLGVGVVSALVCLAMTRSAFTQDSKATESAAAPANPSKAECAAAYEAAQESRAAGQLRKTRERLEFCAQPECPSFVQRDCSRWFSEVERELPSVRISARDWDGASTEDLQVKLDGERVPEPLADRAIALDPGQHEFVFERTGHAPITRTIVAQQGVQNRVLVVDFGPPSGEAMPGDRVQTGRGASLKPYAYAAWALGAVGFGTFAVMGTIGRSDKQALEDDCPEVDITPGAMPRPGVCVPSQVDDRNSTIDREFLFADIGLIVGIAGVVGGTALFLLSPSTDRAPATGSSAAPFDVDVRVMRGGARATVGGTF